MDGLVTRIQRFSIHDGPGIRTTVFLKGCQLSCIWCQNPEAIKDYPEVVFYQINCIHCGKCAEVCQQHCFTCKDKIEFDSNECIQCGRCIDICPVNALKWSSLKMSSEDVLKEVTKDREYYDISGGGVTLSGGEPLRQIEFCVDFFRKAKSLGLHLAVDTSGFIQTELLDKIVQYVDLFLYDIKFIDAALHFKYTGQSNDLILTNFQKIYEENKIIVVRVPLVPGITDKKENLSQINKFVKTYSNKIKIQQIPFNNLIKDKYKMLGKDCSI